MVSLCATCEYFMLVKIEFTGSKDVTKRDCLVKSGIFNDLKVGHYRDNKGLSYDAHNVKYCTHYDKKYDETMRSIMRKRNNVHTTT